MEMFLRIAKRKDLSDFEIRWPTPAEMKESATISERK